MSGSSRRRVASGLVAVVFVLGVGGAAGCSGGGDDDSASGGGSSSTTAERTTMPTTTTAPPSSTSAPTTAAPPATTTPTTAAAGRGVMPEVPCGTNLQDAQDIVQEEAGVFLSLSEDATGQGRMQVLDRNWTVVGQSPPAGTPIGEGDAVFQVVKNEEFEGC
jgi:hypothetical protein